MRATTASKASLDAPASVSTEVLSAPDRFAELESFWNDLVDASSAPNVFTTWEWVSTWREAIAPDDPLRVVVVRDSGTGRPVGLAPFVIRSQPRVGPTLWRELVFMGSTVTAPDHLDCIAVAGREHEVSCAVSQWLTPRSGSRGWDIVRLDGVSPSAPMVRNLLERAHPSTTAMWALTCPYIPLPSTWEEYEEGLSTKFARNNRRRFRKLGRESQESVAFDTTRGGEELDGALEDLFRLHEAARQANGESGHFDSDVKRRFYRLVARRLAERGWLRLHRLRVGGEAIAAALCFHHGGRAMCYQMGYDLGLGQYGPGYLITKRMIECAIEEGATEMDMLRGDHAYKYEWNAERRSILKLRLASTVAGGMVAPATRWLRAAKNGWRTWRRTHWS